MKMLADPPPKAVKFNQPHHRERPAGPSLTGQDRLPSNLTRARGTTMPSPNDTSSLDLDIDGDRAVVRIPATHFGAVDGAADDERLLSLLGELAQTHLSLDFGNVTFLSSIGLALLLRLHKCRAESGRRLAVLNLQPHVYELFSVTRLNTVLDVCPQEAA
jgi:anti-anti-sigma factor